MIAEQATPFGVQVTAMGVGLDYDELTLNELAVRSSGRLYHLEDSHQMSSIVETELALLQSTVATGASVEIVPAPGIQLVGVSGVRTEWAGGGALRVPIGAIFGGQRRELLVRFRVVDKGLTGSNSLMSARLNYLDASDGAMPRVIEAVVRAERTDDPALVREHENRNVQAIVAMQQAAEIANAARAQVGEGRFDDADAGLARAERQLRDNAAQAKHADDKRRMMQAAERVSASRRSVQNAKAAPAPARAKASRASSLMLNDTAMESMGF
jgi:Ca-activated chloride channel family protein